MAVDVQMLFTARSSAAMAMIMQAEQVLDIDDVLLSVPFQCWEMIKMQLYIFFFL